MIVEQMKVPDTPKISVWAGDNESLKLVTDSAQALLIIYRVNDAWRFGFAGGNNTHIAVHAHAALSKLLEMEPKKPEEKPIEKPPEKPKEDVVSLKLPIPGEVPP